MKVKTIDIDTKEWFDRINGNSYFAGTVTINYSMKTEKVFTMPFEYGYGSHSYYQALKLLIEKGLITSCYFSDIENAGIIVRHNKQENCLKRDLMVYKKEN